MKRRLSQLFTFVLLLTQLEGMAFADVMDIGNAELEKLLAQGVAVIDLRQWQPIRENCKFPGSAGRIQRGL